LVRVHEPEIYKVSAIAATEAESDPAWDKVQPTAAEVQEAVAVAVQEVVQEAAARVVVAAVTEGNHLPHEIPASIILVGAGDIFISLLHQFFIVDRLRSAEDLWVYLPWQSSASACILI